MYRTKNTTPFLPPIQVPREEMDDVKQIINNVQIAGKGLVAASLVAGATNLVAYYGGHQPNATAFHIVHAVATTGVFAGYNLSRITTKRIVEAPLPHPREQARDASKNQPPRIRRATIASTSATETYDIAGDTLPAIELNDHEQALFNGLCTQQFRGLETNALKRLIVDHLRSANSDKFANFKNELLQYASQRNSFKGKNDSKLKALETFLNTEKKKFVTTRTPLIYR